MATQTKVLASVDNGAFTLSFDYDDVSFRILSITAVNNGSRDYQLSARSTSTGRQYDLTISPGTITQNIPQQAANRLQLSVTPSGKLDGVEWSVS